MSVRGFNTGSGIEQYDYDYLDNKPAAPTKESIGLGNVDNTSDADKPVSTAQEQALSNKVDKVAGMGLSQEDYTSEDKAKLEALPTNSELETALSGKASAEAVAALESAVNDPDNGLDTKAPAIISTASGAIVSFSDGADSMPVKKLIVNVEPVQAGSGDPSPDNVRPISGWTGAEIEGTGINIWDEEWESGSFSTSTGLPASNPNQIRSKNYIPILPNTTYYGRIGESNLLAWFYDLEKNFISPNVNITNSVFVTPPRAHYMKIATYSSTIQTTTYNHNISINYPATDTAYHAYEGNQISITFPSAAGTVYGATLTINPDRTGELVVDSGIFTVPSNQKWYVRDGVGVYCAVAGMTNYPTCIPAGYGASDGVKCSRYNPTKAGQSIMPEGCIGICSTNISNNFNVYLKDASITTPAEAQTALAGMQIVYPLATPITYTLTESEISGILTTLYGTNNIWADCGRSTVEYTADTKLYIEQLTQPTEDDMTADHAIASGTFFMIGNNLYLATSQIAAGATITPGTNATKLSLADALNQLNA